jgi:hypothetical protein
MSISVISIAGSCLLGALIVGIGFYNMYRSAQKARDGYARAKPASARLIKIGHSESSQSYGTVDVHLTFEVHPPQGEPYQVKNIWSVDPVHVAKLQEGMTVKVRISADDRTKLYSDETWAQSLDLEQDSLPDE